ncbi:unnamed protein product [marine sediment metagenome]|uniref:Uncharacterized protein n=1 Tax=marine sediment metagenome TaxID=412755 RepID=X1IYI5_9ZZZZ
MKIEGIMPQIMASINASWWWLGPWLLINLGIALIALIVDLIKSEIHEWKQ